MRIKQKLYPLGRVGEQRWVDPRTHTRLAPGALQNWPSKSDGDYLKQEHRTLAANALVGELAQAAAEAQQRQKAVEGVEAVEAVEAVDLVLARSMEAMEAHLFIHASAPTAA